MTQARTTPQVSVLIPVRNASPTLAAALRSVQKQEGVAWECVCVDDHSSDHTRTILDSFARTDPRFRVFTSPRNGLVAALQFGLAQSKGEFIARMDADDAMHPRRLVEQYRALVSQPHLFGIGCRVRLFPTAAVRSGFERYVRWLDRLLTPEAIWRERFIECPVVHPTLMLRRAVLECFPYRDMGWPEDYDLMLRILENGARLGCLPERLHFWRVHRGKTSLNDRRYSQRKFVACKAHYLARGPLCSSEEYLLWGYGSTGRQLCRALRNFGKRPHAIIEIHPRRLGTTIAGAPVLPPEALVRMPRMPLLVSVAHPSARTQIRQYLQRTTPNLNEGTDWMFTA